MPLYFNPGTKIIKEGDPGELLYIIKEGNVLCISLHIVSHGISYITSIINGLHIYYNITVSTVSFHGPPIRNITAPQRPLKRIKSDSSRLHRRKSMLSDAILAGRRAGRRGRTDGTVAGGTVQLGSPLPRPADDDAERRPERDQRPARHRDARHAGQRRPADAGGRKEATQALMTPRSSSRRTMGNQFSSGTPGGCSAAM